MSDDLLKRLEEQKTKYVEKIKCAKKTIEGYELVVQVTSDRIKEVKKRENK